MPTSRAQDPLGDLRRARRKNRMAELDWFEAAYRVYLVAFAFGGSALWLSGFVKDSKVANSTIVDIFRNGPAVLGMFAVIAFAAGIRSGSRGGPLAIEDADVRHVLLSPIDRRSALLRPASQRARSAAFSGLIVGALAGELAGRRLPGSVASWTFTGAAFGATLSVVFIGAALTSHALHIPRWFASLIGAAGIAWQGAAITQHIVGPGNLNGSLALWGMRQRGIDLIAVALAVALLAIGLLLLRRTSLDALARRSGLVAQLHFAVTMQDLRTVMLLRRQLSQENTRSKPWVRLRRAGTSGVVWRRGWHSLLRFPVSRLLRMSMMAIGAAVCQVAAFDGTTALFLVSGGLLFLLGMEALEPLSQEIDQPDRMSALPHERGALLLRHTAAPLLALLPFAALAVGTVAVLKGAGGAAIAGVLALPTIWAGAAGAAVSIVKDAPDMTTSAVEQTMMPPEMSGMTTIVRMLLPLVVSIIGSVGVLAVRAAHRTGKPELATAIRMAVAQLMLCAFIGWWVRRRDAWKIKFNAFMAEGKQASAQQRAARSELTRS